MGSRNGYNRYKSLPIRFPICHDRVRNLTNGTTTPLEAPSMRSPRVRFTVRRMMVLVALAGVACLGARESWAWWLRRNQPNPVYRSRLTASAGRMMSELGWVAGRPIPVVITYDFKFRNPKPAPGTTCVLFAQVWFEDRATGRVVDSYTFDAPLSVGGREAASGSLTWDALLPRAGRYQLHRDLYYKWPTGDLRRASGGSTGYNVEAAVLSSQRPGDQGAPR
jgi:hypothetical protein